MTETKHPNIAAALEKDGRTLSQVVRAALDRIAARVEKRDDAA